MPNSPSQPNSEITHPIYPYLHAIKAQHQSTISGVLQAFNTPRATIQENFVAGIQEFVKIAHDKRSSPFLGLNYNTELTDLWNTQNPTTPISYSKLAMLSPHLWERIIRDGYDTLIYKGKKPAEALDELLKGPSVIDCGMFTQLGLWFGLRYLLGNERFNQCFGRGPFFITQNVWNPIHEPDAAHKGNPLFPFFNIASEDKPDAVVLTHIPNVPNYLKKHPGGSAQGQNCMVFRSVFYMFEPQCPGLAEGTSLEEVYRHLREAYNKPLQAMDREMLHFWQQSGRLTDAQLAAAEALSTDVLDEASFNNKVPIPTQRYSFDLTLFLKWLHIIEAAPAVDMSAPKAPADSLPISLELIESLPHENKAMCYERFQAQTPEQERLLKASAEFVSKILKSESALWVLTGGAGCGKTASAVCAAKALEACGKRVLWISEASAKRWGISAIDTAFKEHVCRLLATNPDAVFLDDDNLFGKAGIILLELIYSWYANNPGKGLFMTSNTPITFEACYGRRLEGYDFPPFIPYTSPAYGAQCWIEGLRAKPRQKIEARSVGAVVSSAFFKEQIKGKYPYEFIPFIHHSFLDGEEIPQTLSQEQQGWIMTDKNRLSIKEFIGTNQPTIIIEIGEELSFKDKKPQISEQVIYQLMRVIHYTHDKGHCQVLIVNLTSFVGDEFLTQLKKQLPHAEQERISARLACLLVKTEETIKPCLKTAVTHVPVASTSVSAVSIFNAPQQNLWVHGGSSGFPGCILDFHGKRI